MAKIAETIAGKLVRAFGDVEEMAKLYAPEIEWSLPPSLPYPVPMKGYEAVLAFNRMVWAEVYHTDCSVDVLDEIGGETASAVRFIYTAEIRSTGKVYRNEYTLFARHGRQGITDVFEAMDLTRLAEQFSG